MSARGLSPGALDAALARNQCATPLARADSEAQVHICHDGTDPKYWRILINGRVAVTLEPWLDFQACRHIALAIEDALKRPMAPLPDGLRFDLFEEDEPS